MAAHGRKIVVLFLYYFDTLIHSCLVFGWRYFSFWELLKNKRIFSSISQILKEEGYYRPLKPELNKTYTSNETCLFTDEESGTKKYTPHVLFYLLFSNFSKKGTT